VTQTSEGAVVIVDEEENYFIFERAVVDRARVPAKHRAALQTLLAAEGQVQGYGAQVSVPPDAMPQTTQVTVPPGAMPQTTQVTIPPTDVIAGPKAMIITLIVAPPRLFTLLR
jgi:hypothetical protein